MASILTLYYHRVDDLEKDKNLLAVSPDNFRQQMLWLRDNFNIVRTTDDWYLTKEDSVCITFDDGYVDNLINVVPILEELHIPATVFVSTMGIRQYEQVWWDQLEFYILNSDSHNTKFRLQDDIFDCCWETDSTDKRINCYNAMHFLMKNYADFDRREKWLMQISDWSKKNYSKKLLVNKEQCIELASCNFIDIGGHTISHPSLATLDSDIQKKEIEGSITDLENLTKKDVNIFSYPFGTKNIDYNEKTTAIVKQLQLEKIFTTNLGIWNTEDDLIEIPRMIIRNWNVFEFAEKIKSYWQYKQ